MSVPRLIKQSILGDEPDDLEEFMKFQPELNKIVSQDKSIVLTLKVHGTEESQHILNDYKNDVVIDLYNLRSYSSQQDNNRYISTIYVAYARIPRNIFTDEIQNAIESFPGEQYIYGYVILKIALSGAIPEDWTYDSDPIVMQLIVGSILHPEDNVLNTNMILSLDPYFLKMYVKRHSQIKVDEKYLKQLATSRIHDSIHVIKWDLWWFRDNGKYHQKRLDLFKKYVVPGVALRLDYIHAYQSTWPKDKPMYVKVFHVTNQFAFVQLVQAQDPLYQNSVWALKLSEVFNVPNQSFKFEPVTLGVIKRIQPSLLIELLLEERERSEDQVNSHNNELNSIRNYLSTLPSDESKWEPRHHNIFKQQHKFIKQFEQLTQKCNQVVNKLNELIGFYTNEFVGTNIKHLERYINDVTKWPHNKESYAFLKYKVYSHPIEGQRIRKYVGIPETEEEEADFWKQENLRLSMRPTRHRKRQKLYRLSEDLGLGSTELPPDTQWYITQFLTRESFLHD